MKLIFKTIKTLILLFILCIVIVFAYAYLAKKPDIGLGHYIKLYDRSYNLIYNSSNNNDISIEDVSPYFINSIISIEDHRFYKHHGFDIQGMLRAIITNIKEGRFSEGASTITQQYARLLYLTNEKSIIRKAKELIYALRLEAHYDKKQILEGYINTLYYGHGIYGIKDASYYYFNKHPRDLDYNEASMLAGVVNGPSYYSPFIDEENAKKRQRVVLNALVKQGHLNEEEANIIHQQQFILNNNHQEYVNNFPYFKDTVLKELDELGFYKESYINQGLNIETTLNSSIQEKLNKTTQQQMSHSEDLQIASIIADSKTSAILALVGGKNYNESQFNRATSSSRQIASTIKPLLYYIALENGFTPTTMLKSEKTTFRLEDGETYSPSNNNDLYANKDISLANAIALSDNIYAVKTHLFLGEQALVNMLNKFGYKNIAPHPSLALGTLNTNIYDLSKIYLTFANTGIYNKPHTINKITTSTGKVLYEYKPENNQLLNEETTLILNQLLTTTFNEKFNSYAKATMCDYKTNATYACKSGTSAYDSLCVGYNPQYTILNWVGYDDNKELTTLLDHTTSKKIFQIMANHLSYEDIWYDHKNLNRIPINPQTNQYDEKGKILWFKDK